MINKIEKGFFTLLQSDIILTIDGKRYKHGKFLNFKMKEFHIQMELIVNDKFRKVDIPFPFKIENSDNSVIFSYKLDDMGSYGADVLKMLQNVIGGGKSKLYNKELVIRRSVDGQ